jgi:hypothetical protein
MRAAPSVVRARPRVLAALQRCASSSRPVTPGTLAGPRFAFAESMPKFRELLRWQPVMKPLAYYMDAAGISVSNTLTACRASLSRQSFAVDVNMRGIAVRSMAPATRVRSRPLFSVASEQKDAFAFVLPFLTMGSGHGECLPACSGVLEPGVPCDSRVRAIKTHGVHSTISMWPKVRFSDFHHASSLARNNAPMLPLSSRSC